MEQSQGRIGIFAAAENMRNTRYVGVSLTTDEHGHAAWMIGGTTVSGVLMNNPLKGEAAYVAFSGVVPVQLAINESVLVGDSLAANTDGTFSKGAGSLVALYDTNAGGHHPCLHRKVRHWR